jgi:hypothetical protein
MSHVFILLVQIFIFRNVFMIISLIELDQEGDNVQADDMQYLGKLPGLDSLSSQTGPS